MAIVSSSYVAEAHTQRDGSTWIRETHVDHLDRIYQFDWLAAVGADRDAVLAARAVTLWDSLVASEGEQIIHGDHVRFEYITKTQLAAIFRERFRRVSGMEAGRMATWLLDRIDDGTFTDNQVRNAFGMDATQYANAKVRFQTIRTNYLAALAAQGE